MSIAVTGAFWRVANVCFPPSANAPVFFASPFSAKSQVDSAKQRSIRPPRVLQVFAIARMFLPWKGEFENQRYLTLPPGARSRHP